MMLTNAFIGLAQEPTDDQLREALGARSAKHWSDLVRRLYANGTVDGQEWKSYSKKHGWALRLQKGTRNIVYLTPAHRAFMVGFALGQRAVTAALAEPLPEEVLTAIREAKRYVEGTAVRLEVRSTAMLRAVETLSAIKLAN